MSTVTAEIEGSIGISRWFASAKLAWILGAVLLLGLVAALTMLYFNRSSSETHAARLSFNPPPELAFNDDHPDAAVISPDGQKIAFTGTSADGKNMLYVRALDSTEAKLLPGSENALEPFWSPDSRSIAYGSNGTATGLECPSFELGRFQNGAPTLLESRLSLRTDRGQIFLDVRNHTAGFVPSASAANALPLAEPGRQ